MMNIILNFDAGRNMAFAALDSANRRSWEIAAAN
jgi:hypothetical protein